MNISKESKILKFGMLNLKCHSPNQENSVIFSSRCKNAFKTLMKLHVPFTNRPIYLSGWFTSRAKNYTQIPGFTKG